MVQKYKKKFELLHIIKKKVVPLQPLFRVTDGGKSRVARLCCVGTIQQHY